MQPNLHGIERQVAPFIRWAGGKTWLIPRLRNLLPKQINNYHEPFLGGGAMFFALNPRNESFLSDLNLELINTYRQLKKCPERVIENLREFKNDEVSYYKLRAEDAIEKDRQAARFIFLNKTSYNGIYRVNRTGKFNVPYGHDEQAPIFEETNLLGVKIRLLRARLYCEDFGKIADRVEKNDLVFLDPPYTVAHNNNGFIEYNQKLFTWSDQQRLAELIAGISNIGAKFILTNAVHESVRNLFRGLGNFHEFFRFSTITSKIGKRRQISEYVITNCF